MKKAAVTNNLKRVTNGMRREFDFSRALRGKYTGQLSHGASVVIIEPDVTGAFPDSQSVNEALRLLIRLARRTGR